MKCSGVKLWAFVVLGALLSGSARADTAAQTLEGFGFFGVWAQDCSEGASLENTLRTANVGPFGDAVFSESLGTDSEPNNYVVLRARLASENTIVLRVKLNGRTEQELTMRREGNRIRTMTNRDLQKGRLIVKDGVVRIQGGETPWLTRCRAADGVKSQ